MPDLTYAITLPLLEFFRKLMGNYGWAIIVVTVLIKLLLLPLSIKQSKESKKMQTKMAAAKPELDRLKERLEQKKKRHAGDNAKLEEANREFQEEMVKVYKENGGFNPLPGCLPSLLQLPIILALYWTFSGPPFKAAVTHIPMVVESKAGAINFMDKTGTVLLDTLELRSSDKVYTVKQTRIYDLETSNLNERGINVKDGEKNIFNITYNEILFPNLLNKLPNFSEYTLMQNNNIVVNNISKFESLPVHYVDTTGKLGRYRFIGDVNKTPENNVTITTDTPNTFKLERVSGTSQVNDSEMKIFLQTTDDAKRSDGKLPKELLSTNWHGGVFDVSPVQNGQFTFTMKNKPDENHKHFSLGIAMVNPRGHQPFLFIRDLSAMGVYDQQSKQIHWDIAVLLLLMGLSFVWMSRSMESQTPQMPDLDPAQETMRKQMKLVMPVMFVSLFAIMPVPSAVLLYFLVSNVFQIVQSAILNKTITDEKATNNT